jgi:anti-sigma28 factor (negative regulator of flagellin synthesis)
MKPLYHNSFPQNLLRKDGITPITGGRTMQISSVSTTSLIPVQRSASSQSTGQTTSSTDSAEINFSADTFSSLVKDASNEPDVRTDLVNSFKSRIHSGHYPAQDVIAGLTKLLGGGIANAAREAGNVTIPANPPSDTSSDDSSSN